MTLEEEFARAYPFALDGFQQRANAALASGSSVLVCAPTGAGKTVVGEFAVWLALKRGGKAFYTTPIKALSNQKFGDFIAHHGASKVGLLTGDNSINGEAPVVVMTTEVLRNMLYEASPTLDGVQVVVMDEVHYLKDPYRGATWEEVLIHLPQDVQVAALSATVSNANEFGEWLRSVRGPTEVVVETKRPVPIEHEYMVGPKLHPMFVHEGDRLVPNPALRRVQGPLDRGRSRPSYRGGGGKRPREQAARGVYVPDRVEVVERLRDEGMLPVIAFIFSRNGCEQGVQQCLAANISLTDREEEERIREYVEVRTSGLPVEDHEVLGYERWVEGLARGFSSHHAGLIPLFKETVEELFERALVKAVFATETLALGINMPAKTVVIERLMKFTGERHEMLTPGDYTQLTGRAGRRGMDPVGYGVVLLQRDIAFDRIVQLAEGRNFPLSSSFRPSYNMAVNLLRRHSVEEAARLLNLSFAQFLADRGVVKLTKQIERNEEFLAGYRQHVECDRGDFAEYWELSRASRTAEKDATDNFRRDRARNVRAAFEALRPGQVLRLARGRRDALAAVVDLRHGKGGEPHPVVVTEERTVRRLSTRDFREPPAIVGEIRLPHGDARAPRFRHEVGRALEELQPREPRPVVADGKTARVARETGAALQEHPVFSCPDRKEHERWMHRIEELERETAALRKRVRTRTETLARTFERVRGVLESFGYVTGSEVTEKGIRLARIYNESDLLVAEAIDSGVFDGLDGADVAGLVSALVYETRIGVPQQEFPNDRTRRAFTKLRRLYFGIHDSEQDAHLELVREPDPGFVAQLHRWASDAPLEDVLDMGEISAGDFVRSTKQVWDLLRQLAELDVDEIFTLRCRQAASAIYRGVVAYSGAL
jgi:ATP-dependent RNA helicase HelY